MYVTPARFETKYLGTDVSGLSALQLASAIQRGARIVEDYTNAPMIPQRHSYLGGTITGERQRWKYPTTPFELGQRRVYPFHTPLITLTQLRIYVTNTQYVEIDPSEVVYQPTERYLEVVSLALTSAGLFNALIIPNVGLATPFGVLNYTYGVRFPITDDLCFATDSTNKIFQASNQFWDATIVPVVKVNGVTKTPTTDYTYDATEGTITFVSAQTQQVTANYTYKCPPEAAEANALIAAYDIGQSKIRSKGMSGYQSVKLGEVAFTRPAPREFASVDNLAQTVPEAATLLGALMHYRASV